MTSASETRLRHFFDSLTTEVPVAPHVPPHRRVLTPAETKAAETTRVAREHTEAEADRRQTQVDRLRQARLEREAQEQAEKAAQAAAPKPKRKRA